MKRFKNYHSQESQEPTPKEEKKEGGMSRRDFLKSVGVVLAGTSLGMNPFEASADEVSEQRSIKQSRVEIMNDHNMYPGFSRYKIFATFENGQERLVGSFFNMEDHKARADFVSNDKNPQFFDNNGRPKFHDIKNNYDNCVLIVAGGFLSSREHDQIEGIALEDGEIVGESNPVKKLNGLLVIKNGVPEIQYLNQIGDINAFLSQAKKEGWSIFQQASFIRPGGKFQSSNLDKYELRFFVEGQGKKGVINFSEDMTYSESLQVMQKMTSFNIEKAIGLDTGIASEGYFYDNSGKGYLMVDEDFGQGRSCTNMLVLYSK